MIFGVLDRRDGLVIAGAILLGSVVISVGHESGPSEPGRTT
jgi:hypothetical protein